VTAAAPSIASLKADLFRAMANPVRIGALELLAGGTRSAGELQRALGVEASHLSQQLAVLRRGGLVTARKDGTSLLYSVKDPVLFEMLAAARRLLLNSLTETRSLLADLDLTG